MVKNNDEIIYFTTGDCFLINRFDLIKEEIFLSQPYIIRFKYQFFSYTYTKNASTLKQNLIFGLYHSIILN